MTRVGLLSTDNGQDAQPAPIDAPFVIARLEEAGATLLALPGTGWTTKLRESPLRDRSHCDRELRVER